MKIIVGSDHGGFHLKGTVVKELQALGHEVFDAGTHTADSVDYPDIAKDAARRVAEGEFQRGVLICGTGVGISIAANKVPGVRAALCSDAQTAEGARRWNDANVLVMSLRSTSPTIAEEMLDAWFATAPDPSEQDNIASLESSPPL